jgi:hypothetical protein
VESEMLKTHFSPHHRLPVSVAYFISFRNSEEYFKLNISAPIQS